jgi:hypothetical protein
VDVQQGPGSFIKLLRSQVMRWHPDRMSCLPGLKDSEDLVSRITLVAQVINDMVRRTRERDAFRKA